MCKPRDAGFIKPNTSNLERCCENCIAVMIDTPKPEENPGPNGTVYRCIGMASDYCEQVVGGSEIAKDCESYKLKGSMG